MKNDDELQEEGYHDDDGDMDDFDLDVEDVKKNDNFQGFVEQTTGGKWQENEAHTKEQFEREREREMEFQREQQQQAAREARLAAQQRASQKAHVAELLLNSSYYNLTLPKDSEKPVLNKPPAKTVHHIPEYYPSKPSTSLLDPNLFSNFDADVLFFAFYYQQDTYSQYLAARELKMRSWRYHKEQNAWFQRREKPTEATDEYERGSYIFFDFKNNWRQEVKDDFKFEYRFLEDELQTPMPPQRRRPQPPTTTGHTKYEGSHSAHAVPHERPQMPVPTQQ